MTEQFSRENLSCNGSPSFSSSKNKFGVLEKEVLIRQSQKYLAFSINVYSSLCFNYLFEINITIYLVKFDYQMNVIRNLCRRVAWPGNIQVYCGGKIVHGPDRSSFYITVFVLIISQILFSLFIAPFIWNRWNGFGLFMLLVQFYLFLLTFSLLLKSAYTDPGIIPRNVNWKHINEQMNVRPDENYFERRKRTSLFKRTIYVKETQIVIHYCPTCHIHRPPRASHCRVCDCCVEIFDHHCPWIGNCVGKRNYHSFVYLLFSAVVLCLFTFSLCIAIVVDLVNEHDRNTHATGVQSALDSSMAVFAASTGMCIFIFIVVLVIGSLCSYHCYLITTLTKSYEDLKRRYRNQPNPFKQSWWKNWLFTMFPPLWPSYVREQKCGIQKIADYSCKTI